MTTRIIRNPDGSFSMWDLNERLLSRGTWADVQAILHSPTSSIPDLDPRGYCDIYDGDLSTCWCGLPSVVAIATLDPRDGRGFWLPRCEDCYIC